MIFRCFKIVVIFFIFFISGCSENEAENMVPMEQINIDDSNNYRYIFKESIDKERLIKKRIERKKQKKIFKE